MKTIKDQFLIKGFAKITDLLSKKEVLGLLQMYDEILADKTRTQHLRSDLAGQADSPPNSVERITQIMRPSLVHDQLTQHPIYQKTDQWAKELLGMDMDLDFDMLINKAPNTTTETPWHQDAAYWINLPDKRAVSFWVALDNAVPENGCMWFVPRQKENQILPHQNLPNGGALYCDYAGADAESIALTPGSCTIHDGFTLHFSRGNTTNHHRRAFILNYRPAAMIALERSQGVDHTGQRTFKHQKS